MRNVQSDTITADSVKSKIIYTITKSFDSIDEAFRQGAKVIFLNATTNESGSYFNQYCLNTTNSFTVKKTLDISIDLIKHNKDFVPLVFSATSFRLSYYINTLAFKIPIKGVGNEQTVDRDKQIELLQQL